jgi:hypothetical protein
MAELVRVHACIPEIRESFWQITLLLLLYFIIIIIFVIIFWVYFFFESCCSHAETHEKTPFALR